VAFNIHAAEPHTRAFACLFEQMAAQVQAQASKQHGKDSGAGSSDYFPPGSTTTTSLPPSSAPPSTTSHLYQTAASSLDFLNPSSSPSTQASAPL
jgi:hypothetical protein